MFAGADICLMLDGLELRCHPALTLTRTAMQIGGSHLGVDPHCPAWQHCMQYMNAAARTALTEVLLTAITAQLQRDYDSLFAADAGQGQTAAATAADTAAEAEITRGAAIIAEAFGPDGRLCVRGEYLLRFERPEDMMPKAVRDACGLMPADAGMTAEDEVMTACAELTAELARHLCRIAQVCADHLQSAGARCVLERCLLHATGACALPQAACDEPLMSESYVQQCTAALITAMASQLPEPCLQLRCGYVLTDGLPLPLTTALAIRLQAAWQALQAPYAGQDQLMMHSESITMTAQQAATLYQVLTALAGSADPALAAGLTDISHAGCTL